MVAGWRRSTLPPQGSSAVGEATLARQWTLLIPAPAPCHGLVGASSLRRWRGLPYRVRDADRAAGALVCLGRWLAGEKRAAHSAAARGSRTTTAVFFGRRAA